jgi:hypothetical protein
MLTTVTALRADGKQFTGQTALHSKPQLKVKEKGK